MVRTKTHNYSDKDYALAKRLLKVYDEAVLPGGTGNPNKTTQTLHMTKAFAAFVAEADDKSISRANFRKLLSRIRTRKAAKSGSSSSASATDANRNVYNQDPAELEVDPAEAEQSRRERSWVAQSRKTGNAPGGPPPEEYDPDQPTNSSGTYIKP